MTRNTAPEPGYIPNPPAKPLSNKLIAGSSICSGLLLGLAMPGLIGVESFWDALKVSVITGSAILTSYGVSKLSAEKSAELAACNFKGALFASVAAISLVGFGLWSATYSGLVLPKVEERQLDRYAVEFERAILTRTQQSAKSQDVLAALNAVTDDLTAKAECEQASACVTGKGQGRGPVARLLIDNAGRAEDVRDSFKTGVEKQDQITARLSESVTAYRSLLAREELSISERRTGLQAIVSEAGAQLSELESAVPLSTAGSLADELKKGVRLDSNPEAERLLSTALVAHGQALSASLPVSSAENIALPALPQRPGVSSTFSHLGEYLPIGITTAVADVVLPLFAFYMRFLGIYWSKFKLGQTAPRRKEEQGAVS